MEPLRPEQRSNIVARPFAPLEYSEWLTINGWGSIAADRFMLYNGLTPVRELHETAPTGYWAFGDDLAGVIACFSESGDGIVYEWDSAVDQLQCTRLRFPEYIRRYWS